jgi:hypothetical protein
VRSTSLAWDIKLSAILFILLVVLRRDMTVLTKSKSCSYKRIAL